MKNTLAIARREVLGFFVSPVAYFVITAFTLLAGYFFFQYLLIFQMDSEYFNNMPYHPPEQSAPSVNQYVVEGLYYTLTFILVLVVPVLTMRLIAEEKKSGTFELLATSPISVWSIVWGKFLGVATVIFVLTGLTFLFPLFLCLFAQPEVPPVFTGYLGLLLCGLGFASIGMACSSFTENQIVGAVTGFVVLLLLYIVYTPGLMRDAGWLDSLLKAISPRMQLQDMISGVITTQGIVYFLSLIVLGVCVSKTALDAQRWR